MSVDPRVDALASRTTLHMVAKLYYENELSQTEIARRVNVSVATISRILARARAEGIVRIDVRDLVSPDELALTLKTRLGLKFVSVIEAAGSGTLAALAAPLGQALEGAGLGDGSLLGIGWGASIHGAIQAGLPCLPGVTVVPATGGLAHAGREFQTNELVRQAAVKLDGTPRFLHAPCLPSIDAREALLRDAATAAVIDLWDRLDVAVVGISGPVRNADRGTGEFREECRSIGAELAVAYMNERESSLANAAGDVLRHYYKVDGTAVPWSGAQRLIGMTAAQLRRTPLVIGLVSGVEKGPSIVGAAKAGLLNALVTDSRTAEAALEWV